MGGDSEEGGGGSFHWKVRADGQEDHLGSDADGKFGDSFTVSIKLPKDMSPEVFLSSVTHRGGRVYFILPIEDDKKQVQVSWGKNNPNNQGGTSS